MTCDTLLVRLLFFSTLKSCKDVRKQEIGCILVKTLKKKNLNGDMLDDIHFQNKLHVHFVRKNDPGALGNPKTKSKLNQSFLPPQLSLSVFI